MATLIETSKFGPARNAALTKPLFTTTNAATTSKRRKMLWSNSSNTAEVVLQHQPKPPVDNRQQQLLLTGAAAAGPMPVADVEMIPVAQENPGVAMRRSVRTKRSVAHLNMHGSQEAVTNLHDNNNNNNIMEDSFVPSSQEFKVCRRPLRTISEASTDASARTTVSSTQAPPSTSSSVALRTVGGLANNEFNCDELPSAPIAAANLGRTSIGYYDELYMNEFADNSSGPDHDFVRFQPLYLAWVEAERKVPLEQWMPTLAQNEIEQVRLTCIESIFKYVNKRQLGLTTLHLTAYYTNRLFHYYVVEKQAMGLGNFHCLVTATGAAMRMAVKMQEKLHHVDAFRSRPNHIWEDFDLSDYLNPFTAIGRCGVASCKKSVELLNQMERVHLKLLERESMLHIPVASDFLDQYLRIGGWPAASVESFRGLGQFILARTLFLSGKRVALRGTPPSKLAAGALALAVKIINSTNGASAYEFWTKKLESFSHLTFDDIQPTVQALSRMLRYSQSPPQTDALRRKFPVWAQYSWC